MGFIMASLTVAYSSVLMAGSDMAVEEGKTVRMHFKLSVDGEAVEDTFGREPLEFVFGRDPLVPGLGEKIKGLKSGDKRSFTIGEADGFGPHDPRGVIEVPKDRFPEKNLQVGMIVGTQTPDGQPLHARVHEIREEVVVLDFNHPLAGKELAIDLEILDVMEGAPTPAPVAV